MTKNDIRITVVVPVHNVGEYLVECMDSLVRQSLPSVEFMCIDDGSTDSSLNVLRSYSKYDARFTVISQENRGVGPTRNRGIAEAQGQFVAFMDADDYYPQSTTLEALWEGAVSNSVQICGGSFSEDHGTWIRTSFQGVYEKYTFGSDATMSYADYQFDYGYHRFIYSTDLLRRHQVFFPPYIRFQDPPFFVRAMVLAGRFHALKQPTYCYRWGHQVLEWNQKRTFDVASGLRDNLAIANEHGLEVLRDLTWSRLTEEYRERIVARLAAGDLGTAECLLECMRYAPAGDGPHRRGSSMMVEGMEALSGRPAAAGSE